jgi:hypothetical protein
MWSLRLRVDYSLVPLIWNRWVEALALLGLRYGRDGGFLTMEATLSLVLFIFFMLALYKHDILDALLFSAALAVGLTAKLLTHGSECLERFSLRA